MVETLGAAKIEQLLQPYLQTGTSVPPEMYEQLSTYLDILHKWNAKTNLTAVRDPEAIVRRHFGESLYAGQLLNLLEPACGTLLDFGSGAGFPGLPIQLLNPNLTVTVANPSKESLIPARSYTKHWIRHGSMGFTGGNHADWATVRRGHDAGSGRHGDGAYRGIRASEDETDATRD